MFVRTITLLILSKVLPVLCSFPSPGGDGRGDLLPFSPNETSHAPLIPENPGRRIPESFPRPPQREHAVQPSIPHPYFSEAFYSRWPSAPLGGQPSYGRRPLPRTEAQHPGEPHLQEGLHLNAFHAHEPLPCPRFRCFQGQCPPPCNLCYPQFYCANCRIPHVPLVYFSRIPPQEAPAFTSGPPAGTAQDGIQYHSAENEVSH
jgi:hypothetical protein